LVAGARHHQTADQDEGANALAHFHPTPRSQARPAQQADASSNQDRHLNSVESTRQGSPTDTSYHLPPKSVATLVLPQRRR